MEAGNSPHRLILTSNIILAVTAIGFVFFVLKPLILPLTLAFLFYNLTIPALDYLELRLKIPRFITRLLAGLVVSGSLLAFIYFLSSFVAGLIEDIQLYRELLAALLKTTVGTLQEMGFEWDENSLLSAFQDIPIGAFLGGMAGWFVNFTSYAVLVLILFIFILASRRPVAQRSSLFNDISQRVNRYVIMKTGVSAVTGTLVGTILHLLGVELAVLIGMLTFILNFIPNIGSIIATLLPVPIALIDFRGIEWFLAVIFLPGTVQMLFGNFIEPYLQGNSLQMHSITVIISIIIWGVIWGPVGMFVALPLTIIIKVFIDSSHHSRWIGLIMEGRLKDAFSHLEVKR